MGAAGGCRKTDVWDLRGLVMCDADGVEGTLSYLSFPENMGNGIEKPQVRSRISYVHTLFSVPCSGLPSRL